jgi:hypothetical protein
MGSLEAIDEDDTNPIIGPASLRPNPLLSNPKWQVNSSNQALNPKNTTFGNNAPAIHEQSDEEDNPIKGPGMNIPKTSVGN